MDLIPLLVGVSLLLFGYRYYWLVIGGVGFLFGLNIGSVANGGQITPAAVMMGLLGGVIAAFTAVFATDILLLISGFLLGGIVLVQVFSYLDWHVGSTLVTFLLGGMIGLLIAIFAQDTAKILLSSIIGAAIIVIALGLDTATTSFVFLFLTLSGIVAQLFLRRRWN
ncbi:MAG: hypothetical protein KC441_13315 [Anaerolineales bacterium]|nr:hypothetical protein [Anaerolineales bacterium]